MFEKYLSVPGGLTAKILFVIVILLILSYSGTVVAERLAVAVPVGNIRSGPGTGYDILWKVEKYYPISILKRSGLWYNFRDFEGDRGWIHKSLVREIPTVITVKRKCNIRSGPGTHHRIVFTAQMGVPFRVINRKGDWIHVQHSDGDKGWIHRSLIW